MTIEDALHVVDLGPYVVLVFETDSGMHVAAYDHENDDFPLGSIVQTSADYTVDALLDFEFSILSQSLTLEVTVASSSRKAIIVVDGNIVSESLERAKIVELESEADSETIKGCANAGEKVFCVVQLTTGGTPSDNLLIYDKSDDSVSYKEFALTEGGTFGENFEMKTSADQIFIVSDTNTAG